MRWHRSKRWVLAASLALAGRADAARAPLPIVERDYDCKIIASTRELPGLPADDPPRMNAWGQVAFFLLDSSTYRSQIRVGHGDLDGHGHPITHLFAEDELSSGTSGFYLFGVGEPTIEDGGSVVFGGSRSSATGDGGPGIFRASWFQRVDKNSAPVVQSTGLDPQSPYMNFPVVSTNSVSSLLFQANDHPRAKLYVGGNLVAQDGVDHVVNLADNAELIAPGNSSDYGYQAYLDTGESAIFLNGTKRDGVPLSGSVMLIGLAVNGNIVPVASWVRLDQSTFPNHWTIEFESDLGHATYVDSAIDPVGLDTVVPLSTSINAWNEVAFLVSGGDRSNDTRIFVTDGKQLVHVHCRDLQQTFGAPGFTVTEISPRALNADGQIAFLARTATPDTFLVRADPIPGQSARPTSCTGLDDGTPCDDGNPVTLSSCASQTCVGQPTGLATSCDGVPDYTPCDAAEPGMQGWCVSQSCVGMSPVPESDPSEDGALAALVLFCVRPRRRAAS